MHLRYTFTFLASILALFSLTAAPMAMAQAQEKDIRTFHGNYNFTANAQKLTGNPVISRVYNGKVTVRSNNRLTGRVTRIEGVADPVTGEVISSTRSKVRIRGKIHKFNRVVKGKNEILTVQTNLTFSDGLRSRFTMVHASQKGLIVTSGSGLIKSKDLTGTTNLTKF